MIISVSKSNKNTTMVKRIINTQSINIINRVKVIPLSNKSTCTISPHMTSRNTLYLDGCLKKYEEVRISLPINNPSLKTLNTVKRYLQTLNITYTGTVIIGNLPHGVKPISYISSATLFPLLKHMLLHSDNLYAESIARSIGYKLNGSGNINSSTKAIKNIINKKLNLNTEFLTLKDGSGLSLLDKTSPQLLVNLLTKTFNMPRIGNELYNALPQSGISGTLSYRMNKQLQGKVRAKTGTLKGTVTLSGYVITKRKNQLTFSIMINNLKKSQRNSARAFQNNLVKLFYDNY
jgi:D-alanyl-D-alanine carboxypeptidase/D-alanyl-D-alanine-endopeptidase (penicillin-binding protein 4)